MKIQLFNAGKIVLATFVFSAIIMYLMRIVAKHIGAMDKPTKAEGHRHIHKVAMPKLGGLGIFLGFLFGYMLFGEQSVRMNSILIGSFLIILIGIMSLVLTIHPLNNKQLNKIKNAWLIASIILIILYLI